MLSVLALGAQDARNRTEETIVQDVLAQLPASTKEIYDTQFADLAGIADKAVVTLSGMFRQGPDALNSKLEYAISGLVTFVTDPGHSQYKESLRKGFRDALLSVTDARVKAFLLTQYRLFADREDIPVFLKYLDNETLASLAMSAIISTEGGREAVAGLFNDCKEDVKDRDVLVNAAAQLSLAEAEPYLIQWYAEAEGDMKGRISVALGKCGSEKSMKLLSKGNVQDYINLIRRIAESGNPDKALKAAKALLKNDDAFVRAAALDIIVSVEGKDASTLVVKTLKDGEAICASSALEAAETFADEEFYAALSKSFRSFPAASRERVVYWLGECGVSSQVPFIERALEDIPAVQSAAIISLGKIGGDQAVSILLSLLMTSDSLSVQAEKALLYCHGNITPGIKEIIANPENKKARITAMSIASKRGVKEASDEVFALLDSEDAELQAAAYAALSGVVAYSDADRLASLAEKVSSDKASSLIPALVSVFRQCTDKDIYAAIARRLDTSARPYLYFPSLAFLQNKAATDRLYTEYSGGKYSSEALAELMKVTDPSVLDHLWKIGKETASEAVVARYVEVLQTVRMNNVSKYSRYADLLKTNPSVSIVNNVLAGLGNLSNKESFTLALSYIDNPETFYQAALAVKNIGSRCRNEIDYQILKNAFDKAKVIFSQGIGRDDAYAISEMEKVLSEVKPEPRYELTEEEKERGFEILFDGTNLDKWIGEGSSLYEVVNGAITVSANFGARNLYTKDEYRDFILRFEFCFTAPAANNGVGIRTPIGVNAAYHGMCEVQILDHDDPVYADLREYQVHGSVYGVIPARRIVHKPLGEWGSEEIEVRGDHIKVTVNGEVILDGNIREACKGHNVAPDGSNNNPYTIDGRNHPGMFNEKGHIGFLGHGPGIKIKNVRVLNLDK